MKNKLIGIFVCMLLITTVLPVSGTVLMERTSISTLFGNTLYVGGSGPGNYSTIQEAINDAVDGDTVFVYDDSSPYVENLIVDKSISLIGEDKHMTVIDGNENEEGEADVVHIKADGVIVQGFTIQNGSLEGGHQKNHHCGIEIRSDNNIIKDNVITDNYFGTQIGSITSTNRRNWSNYNIIEGNIIINNTKAGIHLMFGCYNNITENNISLNPQGIAFRYDGCNNLVTLNTISLNKEGIFMAQETKTTIQRNTIVDNDLGVEMWYSKKCKVIENNIFNNGKDADIKTSTIDLLRFRQSNTWDSNYWGETIPNRKLITGTCDFVFLNCDFIYSILKHPLYFPLIKVDWNPAQESYDIGV